MSDLSHSSSRNGLSHLFARSRNRDKSKRSSTAGSSLSTESDNTLDTFDQTYAHDEDSQDPSSVKKLVGKTIGRRRRKRQELADEQLASEEAERGRSVVERGTLKDDAAGITHIIHSKDHDEDDDDNNSTSSLVTFDDEPRQKPEKPLLSTHPSHIGYLTSSSPLVQTTSISVASVPEAQLDGIQNPQSTSRLDSMSKLATSDSTPSLVASTLRAPEDGSHKRSPSPVGRLREALKPKKSASPDTSPERKVRGLQLGGSTTSLALEGSNRRGSVSSRLGNLFPERSNTVPIAPSPAVVATPERPRTAKITTVDEQSAPSTPPAGDVAPTIVNTPPTPTDFSAPRFPPSSRDRGSSDPVNSNSNVVTSPSGNMISHRRARSGSANLGPSKLSNIQSAPLTPTPEHPSPSPNPSQQTGFFSSVFSAAQNAATTFNNITTLAPGNKSKGTTLTDLKEVENPVVETLSTKTNGEAVTEEKELAVKTLGMGDLSLSHLGITENSAQNTPMSARFPEEIRGRSESTNTYDETHSSRVLGAPFAMHDNTETGSTSNFDDATIIRPRSFYGTSAGERTPPNGSVFEGKSGVHRSGSIRSNGMGRRRKRNSSATTGGGFGAIGAAIAAANGSIANPKAPGEGPKITGFAVASKKRNRDFHQLFRSVPDDDYLIEDYSCALQRDILAHGRLYVSEGHLCFSSNIFGWVTTLVMSFDEIVSVEKRSTALLFKNGLMISTLHSKNVFASFTSRDSTYDLIVGIWKLGHPSLKSSLNGVALDETGGDKTEKYDGKPEVEESDNGSASESEDGSGEDVYDEDEDDEASAEMDDGSVAGSDGAAKVVSRKPSAAVVTSSAAPEATKGDGPTTASGDFPGPATHGATDCNDGDTHYAKIIADEVIPAPLGKIYNLLFGPQSSAYMKDWFVVEQKCLEVTFDGLALTKENKSRGYSYIKPLNGSIGPRQTKCICTENLDFLDLEKAVSVTITTQTPDVPSGNVFSTKTKYCLTWAEGNATRLQMNCTIEWTGKSWLKGPIEKGANDGQVKHAKDLVGFLKAGLTTRRTTVTGGAAGKSKKKGRKGISSKSVDRAANSTSDSKSTPSDWGILEPVHGLFGPIADIAGPLLTGNVLYGLFVGLLVASWFRFGSGPSTSRDVGLFTSPERIAAYEEIWRKEESELWEWLEDRVGMDRLRNVGGLKSQKTGFEEGLRNERMSSRMVEEAVRVTEEKLNVLKKVVEEKKEKVKGRGEPAL